MAKKWRDLYATIPPDRCARIEADVARELAEMTLAEVRRARELTHNALLLGAPADDLARRRSDSGD